jgi:hypothetical protein
VSLICFVVLLLTYSVRFVKESTIVVAGRADAIFVNDRSFDTDTK